MKRLANRVVSEIKPAHQRLVHHGNVRSAFRILGTEFPSKQQGHALGLEIPWTCKVNLHRRPLIRLGRVPRHRDALNHFHVTQPTVKRETGRVDAGKSVDTVQQLSIKRWELLGFVSRPLRIDAHNKYLLAAKSPILILECLERSHEQTRADQQN